MRFEVKTIPHAEGVVMQIICHPDNGKSRNTAFHWDDQPESMAKMITISLNELAKGYHEVLNGITVYYKDEL